MMPTARVHQSTASLVCVHRSFRCLCECFSHHCLALQFSCKNNHRYRCLIDPLGRISNATQNCVALFGIQLEEMKAGLIPASGIVIGWDTPEVQLALRSPEGFTLNIPDRPDAMQAFISDLGIAEEAWQVLRIVAKVAERAKFVAGRSSRFTRPADSRTTVEDDRATYAVKVPPPGEDEHADVTSGGHTPSAARSAPAFFHHDDNEDDDKEDRPLLSSLAVNVDFPSNSIELERMPKDTRGSADKKPKRAVVIDVDDQRKKKKTVTADGDQRSQSSHGSRKSNLSNAFVMQQRIRQYVQVCRSVGLLKSVWCRSPNQLTHTLMYINVSLSLFHTHTHSVTLSIYLSSRTGSPRTLPATKWSPCCVVSAIGLVCRS
jgi:hypothetical protein